MGLIRFLRRLISIFLITTVLLNTIGIYMLIVGIKFRNEQVLIQKLDQGDIDESRSITLKIPLAIPYHVDSYTEYERKNGEFEFQGEFFRLVKQKIQQDTVYLVCVKDLRGKAIHQALKDYVKTFSDKPVEKGDPTTKLVQNLIKDYISSSTSLVTFSGGWNLSMKYGRVSILHDYLYQLIISPPPEQSVA